MNKRVKGIITEFSYALSSNIISLVISILIVMIVPKLIGVSEYGYWQLYIFYSSYLGFFNIGWVEGIYLRYGGEEYHRLKKDLFASQFWSFCLYIIFIGGIITYYSLIYITDNNMQFIFQMLSVCLILIVSRGFLLFVLQATNRIKEYARIIIIDRFVYCLIVILILLIGITEYEVLIIADLISKTSTLVLSMFYCKEIVFNKFVSFYDNLKEIKTNISAGIKLMLANIASMLIIGVVRFGIEKSWDIITFGKVALALGISNFLMIFINAVGIIMFPILRRTEEKRLSIIYITMRDLLMVISFGALIIYYPLKLMLSAWLPKYDDSMIYMALLFPMCVFEGKMALLINTYLKTLRKEKMMLIINLITLVLSVIFTFITTIYFKNLSLAIVSIVMLLAIRCALAESYLAKVLLISLGNDIFIEFTLVLIFILTGWLLDSWIGVFLYFFAYMIYLIIKRRDVTKAIENVYLLSK